MKTWIFRRTVTEDIRVEGKDIDDATEKAMVRKGDVIDVRCRRVDLIKEPPKPEFEIRELVWHCDPGHAWLCVERAELIGMHLIGEISDYSYQRGDLVYLEEDRDAQLFLMKLEELKIPFKHLELDERHSAPVRGYKPFQMKKGEDKKLPRGLTVVRV